MPSLPTTTSKWVITSPTSKAPSFQTLELVHDDPLPSLGDHDVLIHDDALPFLGDHDVLVQIHYASLNYRDLIIPMGKYNFPTSFSKPLVPCSDGAGIVLAVGSRVSLFSAGDRVVTTFNQTHLSGPLSPADTQSSLGASRDGVLRSYAVFEEMGLVPCPANLSLKEASTLPCAGLTAWNALYGLRAVQPGDTVLTQGTGGVALFGCQLAKAAGARVIATTSSPQGRGGALLSAVGADHILDYKTDASTWGSTAKRLTPGGRGVDYILEVGGPTSMAQSLAAVRPEGIISIIGFLGGVGGRRGETATPLPGFLDVLSSVAVVRGVMVGSREQALALGRAIEACAIKPVVDDKVWSFEQAREAYVWMWERRHCGKVVIRVSGESEDEDKSNNTTATAAPTDDGKAKL